MSLRRNPKGKLTPEELAMIEKNKEAARVDKEVYDRYRAAGVMTWREVKDAVSRYLDCPTDDHLKK